MNPALMHKGPRAPEMIATVLGYLDGQNRLGFGYAIREARLSAIVIHMDGNYLMPLRQ